MAAVFYVRTLYVEISALIDERAGALTSSILSAPHEIRVGDDLGRSRLVERLESLTYSELAQALAPGQYTRTASSLSIYLRGYAVGPGHDEARLVHLKLDHGRIAAIEGTATNGEAREPLRSAFLEPETIGRLIPGAPAERVESRLAQQQRYLVDGLLATEDRFFYYHPGINPVRIVKAIVEDIRTGRLAQGASTLTQQLARTFLERRERTFSRKFRELAVAFVIELRLTKDEILERYINDVSLGAYSGAPIHGMPQAARYFFGKDLAQVTPAEAATLIGMVQAPTLYNPRRHNEASTRRRNVVLGVMKARGVIDEAAYVSAVSGPVALAKPRDLRRAPYFTDYVIGLVKTLPGFDGNLAGLKVLTTLDAEVQSAAARAATTNLERLEKNYAALRRTAKPGRLQTSAVVLDAGTGAVRALVGGRGYSESQFNRATSALRQPGSVFKPVVYLAAMDPVRSPVRPPLTLASLLPVQPMSFGAWRPENYEPSTETQVTVIKALSHSLNVPAAYVGSRLGGELMVRTAHDVGIRQDLDPLLPIAIGAEETTLLDLTAAYQVFANQGLRAPVYAIESVVDAAGREIYSHKAENVRVATAEVAYLITRALQMAVESGSGASSGRLGLDLPAAGKTGTTQDYKDAYFVGYTPEIVCGVWVGFDSPRSTGLTGAKAALPAWVEIVRGTAPAQPRDFRRPSGIVLARIDPASGGLATEQCRASLIMPFLAGTAPTSQCELHGGEVTAQDHRRWGDWKGPETVAEKQDLPKLPNPFKSEPFRKVGKFFGSLFGR